MGRWRGCEGGVGPRPPQAGAQPRAATDSRRSPLTASGRPRKRTPVAQVAELVDAPASGAGACKGVEVRVLSWAPKILRGYQPQGLRPSQSVALVRPCNNGVWQMLYRLVRSVKRPDSFQLQFEQRIPADVLPRAAGLRLSIPLGSGQFQDLTISPKAKAIRFSLRTRDPSEGKVRNGRRRLTLRRFGRPSAPPSR